MAGVLMGTVGSLFEKEGKKKRNICMQGVRAEEKELKLCFSKFAAYMCLDLDDEPVVCTLQLFQIYRNKRKLLMRQKNSRLEIMREISDHS